MVVVMLTVELFIEALKAEDDDEDTAQRCVLTETRPDEFCLL